MLGLCLLLQAGAEICSRGTCGAGVGWLCSGAGAARGRFHICLLSLASENKKLCPGGLVEIGQCLLGCCVQSVRASWVTCWCISGKYCVPRVFSPCHVPANLALGCYGVAGWMLLALLMHCGSLEENPCCVRWRLDGSSHFCSQSGAHK